VSFRVPENLWWNVSGRCLSNEIGNGFCRFHR
jgi:hypothetical protein